MRIIKELLSRFYLGFYSGVFFGIFLGIIVSVTVGVIALGSLSSSPHIVEYHNLLGIFYGWIFALLMFIAYFSHLIRRRYGMMCGCTASSFCSSEDNLTDEE